MPVCVREAPGDAVSVWSLGVGTKQLKPVTGVALCLHGWTQIKTPDTKAEMSFPGWQYTMGVATHHCRENWTLSTKVHWEGTTGNLCLVSLRFCPKHLLLCWFSSKSFHCKKLWVWQLFLVLWALLGNHQTWRWSWEHLTHSLMTLKLPHTNEIPVLAAS